MTDRVDLTANRQFSGGGAVITPNVFSIASDFFSRYDGFGLTNEEFDYLVWHESIFGVNHHYSRARQIFHPDDDYDYHVHREKNAHKCVRCGKEIRAPWRLKGELCEECDEVISAGPMTNFEGTHGEPWEPQNGWEPADVRRDLFDLR